MKKQESTQSYTWIAVELRKEIVVMISLDNFPESWECLPAGTEISKEIYDQMLNVLPPIWLRKSLYCGFQMGEPHDHREDANGKWRARFLTFVNIGKRFYYAGINFGGECNWRV